MYEKSNVFLYEDKEYIKNRNNLIYTSENIFYKESIWEVKQ